MSHARASRVPIYLKFAFRFNPVNTETMTGIKYYILNENSIWK